MKQYEIEFYTFDETLIMRSVITASNDAEAESEGCKIANELNAALMSVPKQIICSRLD